MELKRTIQMDNDVDVSVSSDLSSGSNCASLIVTISKWSKVWMSVVVPVLVFK